MSNISPSKPSFVLGYWRPWKEDSNAVDSYLDYAKDISLAKYGADTVGKYISQASKEQVDAVNNLGHKIGAGINVISDKMDSGIAELSAISTKLSNISSELSFLNYNTDILIEQQKLTNLLLQNIGELLRVPDSEKERQLAIELGIKFFVNAQKDADLFDDSLEEFLKAESLMKQDYFVLHRIGLIYMHSIKHINMEKALAYFTKAAKYASVESDPKAMRLINILNKNQSQPKIEQCSYELILKSAGNKKLDVLNVLKDKTNLSFQEFHELLQGKFLPKSISIGLNQSTAENLKLKLEAVGAEVIIKSLEVKKDKETNKTDGVDILEIQKLVGDSYKKAAFAAYVLGQFELAVVNQKKALENADSAENYFLLAKYHARNKEIDFCLFNLEKAIKITPIMALAVFKEIDLFHESEILKLIENKNKEIDNNINELIEKTYSNPLSFEIKSAQENLIKLKNKSYDIKVSDYLILKKQIEDNIAIEKKIDDLIVEYRGIPSKKTIEIINALNELNDKPLKLKVSEFEKYKEVENSIDNDIEKSKKEIDRLISSLSSLQFVNLPDAEIDKLKKELIDSKKGTLEEIQTMLEKAFNTIKNESLNIGSRHYGGIVFYIDKANNYCLVASEKNYKEMVWGNTKVSWNFGTLTSIDTGYSNSVSILKHVSTKKEFLFINKELMTAARFCLNLSVNNYSDWFLPSSEELQLLFKNIINYNHKTGTYWTSSVLNISDKTIWVCNHINKSDGLIIDGLRAHLVLPIRKQLL
jgi:ribosomal protein L7/L12